MPAPADHLAVPKAIIRRAIKALEGTARARAGHSQHPGLFSAENTTEWADAQKLKKLLKEQAGMNAFPVRK